ncbi:pseudaminic acid synthase [Gammaproteobacteria bacterium]|nr:pseudaminic acid synthase [Gammaproteobacteria bacterium]
MKIQSPEMTINDRKIGEGYLPYIIAEMSANHNGKIENALHLINIAKQCGADAVKLQTYTADTLTIDSASEDFMIRGGLWDGKSLYQLYKEAFTPWEWHSELFRHAKDLGITIFSSPFDFSAIDFLEDLGTPAYKIASFEAVDIPLIKYAASTGKPLIISTGMISKEEIAEAVDAAYSSGCTALALLHCVSSYPALPEDYNLHTLRDIKDSFPCVAGLSDHTISNTTAISSIAMGASIIEKHFTLDRKGGGPDDSFSLEPNELINLCSESKVSWQSMGRVDYGLKEGEKPNKKFQRSLYFMKPMKKGDTILEDDVRSIRPGFGLPPKYIDQVIGNILDADVDYGIPVTSEHLKNKLM